MTSESTTRRTHTSQGAPIIPCRFDIRATSETTHPVIQELFRQSPTAHALWGHVRTLTAMGTTRLSFAAIRAGVESASDRTVYDCMNLFADVRLFRIDRSIGGARDAHSVWTPLPMPDAWPTGVRMRVHGTPAPKASAAAAAADTDTDTDTGLDVPAEAPAAFEPTAGRFGELLDVVARWELPALPAELAARLPEGWMREVAAGSNAENAWSVAENEIRVERPEAPDIWLLAAAASRTRTSREQVAEDLVAAFHELCMRRAVPAHHPRDLDAANLLLAANSEARIWEAFPRMWALFTEWHAALSDVNRKKNRPATLGFLLRWFARAGLAVPGGKPPPN